jgi:hypothetical protein
MSDRWSNNPWTDERIAKLKSEVDGVRVTIKPAEGKAA